MSLTVNSPPFHPVPVNLSNCDREPIHTPGAIQPHGALLAFDRQARLCLHSNNARFMLGDLPTIGETCGISHLSPSIRDAIAAAASNEALYEDMPGAVLNGRLFDVIFTYSDDLVLAEFEQQRGWGGQESFSQRAQRAIDKIQRQTSIESLVTTTVAEIAAITGFDRVMGYRFRHDDSGEVISECKRDDLISYLGQRYPAGDIPAQARVLYVLNPLRLIANVSDTPVPLTSGINPLTRLPLGMSRSVLRAVSPIHIEYLTNMGVQASMSISIVIGGKLWGMVACHHMTPHRVPVGIRMACQLLSQIVSVLVERTLSQQHAALVEKSVIMRMKLIELANKSDDILSAIAVNTPNYLQLVPAQGGAAAIERNVQTHVTAPTHTQILGLIEWLQSTDQPDVYFNNTLRRIAQDEPDDSLRQPPSLDNVCGVLAIRFYKEQDGFLFWFRTEEIENIRWGGNPYHAKEKLGPNGSRLTPRGSFDEWKEEVKGCSAVWLNSEIAIASQFRVELQKIALSKASLAQRARDTLFATLGHDLRDPLQAISMAAKMLEFGLDSGDPSAAKSSIGRRITNSSGRMQRLISDVLDVSRLQSGFSLGVNFEEMQIGPFIQELIKDLTSSYPALQVNMDLEQAGTATVDPDRIAQVMSNLLGNARHHGDLGKPVEVSAKQEHGRLMIEVTNCGPAIPEEKLSALFTPFKASSVQNQQNKRGLGLGLYIVSEIVKSHHGTISVKNHADKVTFSISLPVCQAA